MKISSIRQQVKQAGRYSIYVDDAYAFSLSESALLREGIVSGQELNEEQLNAFKQLSADDKLYQRSLRYIAMRARSTGEMRAYLKRKDASDELIEQTIGRLADLGLLDDKAYAASFVRDRQLLRPTSHRKLVMELKKRYISEEIIHSVLASDELDERSSIKDVIVKKRRQIKYRDDDKLMQYLARQGFRYDDIKAAMSNDE